MSLEKATAVPRKPRWTLWALRIFVLLAAVGAAGLFLTTSELRSNPGTSTQATARLQGFGYALDALTGLPVDKANVVVDGKRFTSGADGIYQISGLSYGEKIAVVTKADSVPTAFHFSVYSKDGSSTSVHTPPAYLVPRQPSIVVPAGGGTVYHGQHELSFSSNTVAVTASLTGFGEHPGTPPPPDSIPTAGSPQPPRPPVIPQASSAARAFPLSVFHADFGNGHTATARVPLGVPGTDPTGSALPLLRFNTATAKWEREGNFSVASSGFAQGALTRSGLYMVVTVGRILTSTVAPTGQSTDVISPWEDNSVTFTIPSYFEIDDQETSSDVRAATFWIYGWREGGGNMTGVRVDTAPQALTASQNLQGAEPGELETQPANPCPDLKCPEGTTPCAIAPQTVNGCGSKIEFGGVCTCCPKGTACQVEAKTGRAEDRYDISIGIEEILRQIKAQGEKRKTDMSITAGCFAVAQQAQQ